MNPLKTTRIELLDPILLLDNQNTKLSDAYYIDKATSNVIGKKGTPVKHRIPEP